MTSLETINLDPDIWGPHFWHTIEAVACTLNDSNKENICQFFHHLTNILPCENCRHHFSLFLNEIPLKKYVQNPLTLLAWIYKLKSEIKKRQNREIDSFSGYIQYIIDKYDVPEIYYYIDLHVEYKKIVEKFHLEESNYFQKYIIEFDL